MFAWFALLGGLMLVALIPPTAGGNEIFNLQRSASIAAGSWRVEAASVPAGMNRFLAEARADFPAGAKPPYSYSVAEVERLASIPLEAERRTTLRPNPVAVLNPVSYLPQVPALWLGERLGLSPMALFYLGRLAGLAAGILLTFFAIRAIPVHSYAFAAIALLPTILFSRSTFDADQFTNGLAFLFLAMVIREIVAEGPMPPRIVAVLALTAFLLAQCKSAYLFLPFFALAIPRSRFRLSGGKAAACTLVIVPGLAASAAWMLLLKDGFFEGIRYVTWSGAVFPDLQVRWVLSNPLEYAAVLLRTVFLTSFIPVTILGLIGIFGPPVMLPPLLYPVFAIALAAVFIAEPSGMPERLRSWSVRVLATVLLASSVGMILTLLYVQWTRVGSPVVEGFQGRYLYPMIPLVLVLLPSGGKPMFGLQPPGWVALIGAGSIGATCWVTWTTYWA